MFNCFFCNIHYSETHVVRVSTYNCKLFLFSIPNMRIQHHNHVIYIKNNLKTQF